MKYWLFKLWYKWIRRINCFEILTYDNWYKRHDTLQTSNEDNLKILVKKKTKQGVVHLVKTIKHEFKQNENRLD